MIGQTGMEKNRIHNMSKEEKEKFCKEWNEITSKFRKAYGKEEVECQSIKKDKNS